jgi:NADPH-dependent F420 reductase
MNITDIKIAVVGGTGALGMGLALRWARAGAEVLVGSRNLENAEKACVAIREKLGAAGGADVRVKALLNADAAAQGDIVALTVPFAQQQSTLESIRANLQGKIVIDTTVPLVPPKVGTVQIPEFGSAAVAAQKLLGDAVKVVSAFHNVAADNLQSLLPLDSDVLVFGDDKQAREDVVGLVQAAGMRGFIAGPLANSIAAEALTSVLITINRQYKCHSGVRIVGTGD